MRSRYVYTEWYTSRLIRDIKLKAVLHKQYKKSKSQVDYDEFSLCRARVKNMIDQDQNSHKDSVQKHVEGPKSFWNDIRSKSGSRNPQSILKEGVILTAGNNVLKSFQSISIQCIV